MRSKLPRRGENSADCAKRNQASESILELKIRRKKKGKARGVLDIRKSFPAKNKVAATTLRIGEKLSLRQPPKNRGNGNPI